MTFFRVLVAILLLLAAVPITAEQLDLDQLFDDPRIYGTAPRSASWSPDGERLAFLWNEIGGRFLDLYLVAPGETSPRRLTDLARGDDGDQQPDPYDGGVVAFVWSPDGRNIVFSLGGDAYILRLVGDRGVQKVLETEAAETRLRFSPDGKLLSFIRDGNLWTFDLADSTEEQLTRLPDDRSVRSYPSSSAIESYCWSPDSGHLALLMWDLTNLEDIVIPDYLEERVEAEAWKRSYTGTPVFETMVAVIDADNGGLRWVDFGEQPYFHNSETHYNEALAFSPDSTQLLINWNDGNYSERRIYLADLDDMGLHEIYREQQQPFFSHLDALWSPDGRSVFITSEKDGYRHVYALPRAGGALTQLTSGPWDVLHLEVPEGSDRIFIESGLHHPLERHVYALPLSGGELQPLTSAPGTSTVIASADGRRVAVRFSAHQVPPELYLIDPAGKDLQLTSSVQPEFQQLAVQRPEYFSFTNPADQTTLHGFMVKPSHFDPTRRYPAVLSCIYADIAKNRWISYDLLDHYMAEVMGYVVVRLDVRASQGYGRDFHYGYYQRLGVIDAQEAVSAAAFLGSLPFVDGDRIGIWGSSYGGFLTLMTLFNHPGVFDTGVAWKPVTDWRSYTDDYTAQRLGRPQDFPEVYTRTSPIHHVQGLEDSLLIAHGMLDENVLFQDTVRLVQALLAAGKDFDVIFYPRANHGLTRWQETFSDLMRRTARYFRQNMGVGPVPAQVAEAPVSDHGVEATAYQCGGLGWVVAEVGAPDDDLVLRLEGSSVSLQPRPTGSGVRYSDGDLSFWSKGVGALVERGTVVYRCIEHRRRTELERASRSDAVLWAAGPEPGWGMTVFPDHLVFEADSGMEPLQASVRGADFDPGAGTVVHHATAEGRELEVTIHHRECSDESLGDQGYPLTVEVLVSGVLHTGCGQPLR